jgi:hypothetical protein
MAAKLPERSLPLERLSNGGKKRMAIRPDLMPSRCSSRED